MTVTFHAALQYVRNHEGELAAFFEGAPNPEQPTQREAAAQRKGEDGRKAKRELRALRRTGALSEESFRLLTSQVSLYIRQKEAQAGSEHLEEELRLREAKREAGIPELIDRGFFERARG